MSDARMFQIGTLLEFMVDSSWFIGAPRILRFRNIADKGEIVDYELLTGSLFYMSQSVQKEWEHAIPESDAENARMSLIFRKIMVGCNES